MPNVETFDPRVLGRQADRSVAYQPTERELNIISRAFDAGLEIDFYAPSLFFITAEDDTAAVIYGKLVSRKEWNANDRARFRSLASGLDEYCGRAFIHRDPNDGPAYIAKDYTEYWVGGEMLIGDKK